MSEWILIIHIFTYPLSPEGYFNTVALPTTFETREECQIAGRQSGYLVSGTVRNLRFVCIEQKHESNCF